ncbi:hypothetical protein DFH06DRAFT_1123854 [Mycena polygramma]|nr:hypothetical protein DFH06DRAFT_1123854 [Mycena polygramma]
MNNGHGGLRGSQLQDHLGSERALEFSPRCLSAEREALRARGKVEPCNESLCIEISGPNFKDSAEWNEHECSTGIESVAYVDRTLMDYSAEFRWKKTESTYIWTKQISGSNFTDSVKKRVD